MIKKYTRETFWLLRSRGLSKLKQSLKGSIMRIRSQVELEGQQEAAEVRAFNN